MRKLLLTIKTFVILSLLASAGMAQSCDLTGDLTPSLNTWDRPFADGTCCSGLGPVQYEVYGPFQVSANGNYDISSTQTGWDGYLFIYQNAFDPNNQVANYVAGDDDGNGGIGTSDIEGVALVAGVDYFMVMTAFANGDAGPYSNTISGAGTFSCTPPVLPPGVPTMGEWGLLILALLVLSFATVFMMRRQTAVAGLGNVSMSQSSGIPFDRASFGKMLAVTMLGLVSVFAIAVLAFDYEMTSADVPGALIAGPIGAYLLHLLFGKKN